MTDQERDAVADMLDLAYALGRCRGISELANIWGFPGAYTEPQEAIERRYHELRVQLLPGRVLHAGSSR